MTKYYKIGLPFALGHAILFALIYFNTPEEAQAGLDIIPFLIADIPVSFLVALDFVGNHGVLGGIPSLENIVFSPVLIDGILGSIWWYFLPKFFLPKRSGGTWGSRASE